MIHVRDLVRLRQIVTVFFEEGLGYYITKAKLHYHLPFYKQILPVKPLNDTQRQAIALRKSFERLGPTFQKLGQLLSLRPDLVPSEYCAEFEKLQDQVPSFPFEEVKRIIEEDFQKPLHQIFPTFEQKPLASATIAQVHKAKLLSGEMVAVKVQRPDIKDTIDADLDILFHLAEALEAHFPELRKYHPSAVVKEFALWTRRELNFELERRNALRLREELQENHQVLVPKIFTAYSSSRVLTMEYIEGIKIDNLAGLKQYKINSHKIGLLYFTSILQQALLYGFFHADPHPANIYVTKQGKLVYFDYGIMGELSSADRMKIVRFIRSIPEKNADKSLDIIISLAQDISHANLSAFKEETRPILREVYYNPVQKRSIGKALYQVIGIGAKYGIIFNANQVLMAKAVYQAEGLAMKLNPAFKVSEGLQEFSRQYLHKKYSPGKMLSRVKNIITSHQDFFTDFPEHIESILQKLEKPDAHEEIDHVRIEYLQEELKHETQRQNIALILAIIITGSAFFWLVDEETTLMGIPIRLLLGILALGIFFYALVIHKENKRMEGEQWNKS